MTVAIGVLALQGDFREHLLMLESVGAHGVEVRTPQDLDAVEGLIIPGGESTTIGRLATMFGLIEPIRQRCSKGMPVFGTCAGMIFLATSTVGKEQPQLGVLDACVERNAFGRQVDSFEADLDVVGLQEPMHAVFIRAPWIEKIGADVEVLASVTDANGLHHPVLVRQGRILASSFHPELTDDARLHKMFIDLVEGA
ncbi:MAG: pyridoxal 5'-phosphate synthase glutaminase subunit PdxT [Actinomycetota bacterium]|nr:pyridoxal 5'-phosphate synthase glutaminase subunit PdxT [Actinomycetota bacterium]